MVLIPELLQTIWQALTEYILGWITCMLGNLLPELPCPGEE